MDGDWTVLADARLCVVRVVARGVNAGTVRERFAYDSYGRPEAYPADDFNLDGSVDFFDYDDYVNCFENAVCPPNNVAEVNMDGSVDFFDYETFAAWFDSGSASSIEARADCRALFSGYYYDPATGYMLVRSRIEARAGYPDLCSRTRSGPASREHDLHWESVAFGSPKHKTSCSDRNTQATDEADAIWHL